ncbi:MAG: CNNM domain-containing protein [Phycisphaeraceae bacterium]
MTVALEMTIWSVVMFLGFAASALYSGMETGAYSLNRVRLQIQHHQRDASARTLHRLLADPVRLLTALLIGNNLANYLSTAGLTVIMGHAGLSPWQAIIVNTLIITPILFVFGETLPKDLFAAYADRLMYRLAPVLHASDRLFTWTGLAPLIGGVTRPLMRGLGQGSRATAFHPRRQVEHLMREGVGYGLLSDDQSAIVERVLSLADRRVRDEMTPWHDVITVSVDDDPATLWQLADRTSRSRFPVLDARGRVAGELSLLDALMHEKEQCPPIAELMQPPIMIPASMPLRRGLAQLQQGKVALAIVTDARNRPVGIVTIKDLVEAITGELTTW